MPGIDGLGVIQRAHERGLRTKFILISGYREFDYAYTALKYGVEDYILKPITENEMNATLNKVADQLRQKGAARDSESVRALRALFFTDSFLQELQAGIHSLEELNHSYGTHFTPGCFRMMKIKLDRQSGFEELSGDRNAVPVSAIQAALREYFSYCEDCLEKSEQDGVFVLLNYRVTDAERFTKQATALLSGLRQEEAVRNTRITLCISEEYTDLACTLQSRQQVLDTVWSRLVRGVGRTLIYREEPYLMPAGQLSNLESRLIRSVELINAQELREAMTDFFQLPAAFLSQPEALQLLRRVLDHFFHLHYDRLDTMQDADALRWQIEEGLISCYPMQAVRDMLISHLVATLEELSGRKDMQQVHVVRMACACVEQEYGRNLTLEHVARQVNLSPDYFSRLFKKETGHNFTEYVTGIRMEHARELLRSSDMNISETAYAVGFSDVQYFSKAFKKAVGVKPTEYRKLYQR
jgi:two-component system response regulator YesN